MRNLKQTRMTLVYLHNSRIQTSILCFEKIELDIDSRGRRGGAEGPECAEAETVGCRGAAETGATGIAAVMANFLQIPYPNFRAQTSTRGVHTALAPHPRFVAASIAIDTAAIAHHRRILRQKLSFAVTQM